jgi:hypothetical protein
MSRVSGGVRRVYSEAATQGQQHYHAQHVSFHDQTFFTPSCLPDQLFCYSMFLQNPHITQPGVQSARSSSCTNDRYARLVTGFFCCFRMLLLLLLLLQPHTQELQNQASGGK